MAGYSGTYTDTIKALFFRTNPIGDTLWSVRLALGQINNGAEIIPTPDSCFMATGSVQGGGIFMIKLSQTGHVMWLKRYQDRAYQGVGGLIRTSDNGYLVCGRVDQSTSVISYTAYLLKTNYQGDTLWTRLIDDGNPATFESATSVVETPDGHYAICGYQDNLVLQPPTMVLVAETQNNGDLIFLKTCPNVIHGQFCNANDLCIADNGGFMVAITATDDPWGTDWKFQLMKTDLNGDTLWTRVVNSAGVYSIEKAGSNMYVVCGTNHDPDSTAYRGYLATLDPAGNLIMERFYGSENCCFFEVRVTSDNGYVAAGRSLSSDQKEYPCMVKTDAEGLFTAVSPAYKEQAGILFPNPTTGLCKVCFPPGAISFGIYNQVGKLILSGVGQDSATQWIHLENQPDGCYLVKVVTGDGLVIQKIIKR